MKTCVQSSATESTEECNDVQSDQVRRIRKERCKNSKPGHQESNGQVANTKISSDINILFILNILDQKNWGEQKTKL